MSNHNNHKNHPNQQFRPFPVYSPLDEAVLNICNAHHCFLIGGTALEILMNSNHLKFNRKRSENVFDFIMQISNAPHLKLIGRDKYDLFDLLTLINNGKAEELARLETMLGEVILFEEEADRKLQELIVKYNQRLNETDLD